MTVSLTINGQSFDYPGPGPDEDWGPEATDWASAVTTGMLQKAGGLFTLLDEVDFGATYGLKATYFKSRSSNIAAAGSLRLARTDGINWRNEANSADLALAVDSSNRLTFNGTIIQQSLSVTDTATIDLTLAADVLSAAIVTGSITNSMINASAAIAYSKLNLTGSILNADVNAAAAIAYSKLNLANSIVNADIATGAAIAYSKLALTASIVNADVSASAAIAYSKLALTGSILNADINASAAIAYSKLAALTINRALVSDASGVVSVSAVTSTELGYVSGVTSAIQTQLNAKQATGNYITALTGDVTASGPGSVAATLAATSNATLVTLSALTTAANLATVGTINSGIWNGTAISITKGGTGTTSQVKGSIVAGTGANTAALFAVGSNGQVLTADSTQTTGLNWSSPLTNPMTSVGDIIVGGVAGAATRLAIGASGTVLKGGTTPSYASIVNADVSSSAAIDVAKLANGTANQILYTNTAGTAAAWRTPTNPTLQKFTSGSGTYTTPANVRYIEVYAVGGGGGGAGSGAGSTLGNDGNDTTFGSALITASKGLKGASTGTGGAGGAGSFGAATGVAITGQGGDGGKVAASNSIGSRGGSSAYFGGGGQPVYANDGLAGIANTGGGGAGASSGATSAATGTAGGAGGFVQAKIFSPSATYAYAVGAGGSGGTFGTGGANGGAGAAGQILVWEYY